MGEGGSPSAGQDSASKAPFGALNQKLQDEGCEQVGGADGVLGDGQGTRVLLTAWGSVRKDSHPLSPGCLACGSPQLAQGQPQHREHQPPQPVARFLRARSGGSQKELWQRSRPLPCVKAQNASREETTNLGFRATLGEERGGLSAPSL